MAGQRTEPGGLLHGARAVAQDVRLVGVAAGSAGRPAPADTAAHFLPVEITGSVALTKSPSLRPTDETRIEIALPDGVTVRVGRGVDGEALRRVLTALGR